MIRYTDRTEFGDCSLEISFVGMEWSDNGKPIDPTTLISIRLLERKHAENNDLVPYKDRWGKEFPNIVVPTGVWHGIKLGLIVEERLFAALGESICELSLAHGSVVWKMSYANTPILIILPSSDRNAIYVLYSGYNFVGNGISNNLIKIGLSGNLIWSAAVKQTNDSFTFIRLIDGRLYANTWNGWYGYVDDDSGEMIEPRWSK